MSGGISRNARLYGTEEAPQPCRTLVAGSLSVDLQGGNLRQLCFAGTEAIRGIAFIVRDRHWGTYVPEITALQVMTSDAGFRVTYEGACRDEHQLLRYRAVIEATADGRLGFDVTMRADEPFLTSRAGFVVLHPLEGVAGEAVTVTHTDGRVEAARFPARIAPSQPLMDIRALRHQVAPGLAVTCTMEGDAFEMEDQRNWSDGSFKTYIRPLAEPHPYTLEAGTEYAQRVGLVFEGAAPRAAGSAGQGPLRVDVGTGHTGRMPHLALAVNPGDIQDWDAAAEWARRCGASHLFCTFDPAAGHGAAEMAGFRQLATHSGADLVLEAVLPLRDKHGAFTDDVDILASDVDTIRQAAGAGGAGFAAVSASPACYHRGYQVQGPWPEAPALEAVYAQVRTAFPGVRLLAGMHSYFTEFNRRPPPIGMADGVTHSTCPIVHAADDRSVMETLESLPWIFHSVRELAGDKPYWIGPTALGMRFNPYADATARNPDNVRRASARCDPRQTGVFNAAWSLGYISRAVAGDVDGLCLSAVAGPFAIGGDLPGAAVHFPVFHVLSGLSQRRDARVRVPASIDPARLAALVIEADSGPELWLANLTAASRVVTVDGMGPGCSIQRLDADNFERCRQGPQGFAATRQPMHADALELDAYAVVRITRTR